MLRNRNMILFATLAALLLAAVATGATDVFAEKKGTVKGTVSRWLSDTGVVKYSVFKPLKNSDKVLGERKFDFLNHEIESDQSTFTLKVQFKVGSLHSGDKIAVCATDDALIIHGCQYGIKYKPGKELRASFAFQLVEDDN